MPDKSNIIFFKVFWQQKFGLGSLAFFGTFHLPWPLFVKPMITYGVKSSRQCDVFWTQCRATANGCRKFHNFLKEVRCDFCTF